MLKNIHNVIQFNGCMNGNGRNLDLYIQGKEEHLEFIQNWMLKKLNLIALWNKDAHIPYIVIFNVNPSFMDDIRKILANIYVVEDYIIYHDESEIYIKDINSNRELTLNGCEEDNTIESIHTAVICYVNYLIEDVVAQDQLEDMVEILQNICKQMEK